jgi:hypothetical protein
MKKYWHLKISQGNQDSATNQAPAGNETGKGKIGKWLTPW